MLRLISAAAAASTAFLFTSCGEKKDSTDNGNDSAPTEENENKEPNKEAKNVDTPDSLTDELIVQMNVLADAMGSITDKASAEAAVTQINGVGDAFEAIAARLDKLETPSEEEKQRLEAKMDEASSASKAKMKPVMELIRQNQDVASVIGPAMAAFKERMRKLDPIFERFGKKKKPKPNVD